jgi:hypothetical protein
MPLKVVVENGQQKEVCVLSYSSYSVYKQCPKRYYREKILKEQPVEKDETYTIPGRIVHNSASHFFETGSFDKFDKAFLQSELERMGALPTVNYVKAYGSFDKALNLLLKSAENLMLFLTGCDPTNRYMSEQWFGVWNAPLYLSSNLAIQGAADLIVINPNNTAVLYDFKTSWNTNNLSRDQLLLYTIAAKLKWNIDVTMCSFFLLPTNKQNYFTFTDADRQELLNRLQIAANDIIVNKEKLVTTKNDKCKFCPFVDTCEANKVENEVKQLKEGAISFNFSAEL